MPTSSLHSSRRIEPSLRFIRDASLLLTPQLLPSDGENQLASHGLGLPAPLLCLLLRRWRDSGRHGRLVPPCDTICVFDSSWRSASALSGCGKCGARPRRTGTATCTHSQNFQPRAKVIFSMAAMKSLVVL
jgi:hypothetical protein